MPISTIKTRFPQLPMPQQGQSWESWGSLMVSTLEQFFFSNPFLDTFPKSRGASGELTASGSQTVTLAEVTADTDGRPIMVMASCFSYVVQSASADQTWKYIVSRGSTDVASVGSSLALGQTRADGFVSFPVLDAPSQGRYIYKLSFKTTSVISDYRFRHRVITLMDRLP